MKGHHLPSRLARSPRIPLPRLVRVDLGWLGSATLAACLTLGACSTPPPLTASRQPEPTYATAPGWHGRALSWDKLIQIENWLAGSGPRHWPESVPGAELDLAQGRLDLARREAGTLPASVLAARLDLAEAGFRRVIRDVRSSSTHRVQAQGSLSAVSALRASGSVAERTLAATPSIRTRSGWGARAPNPAKLTPNRGPWKLITVHHSAIEGGTAYESLASSKAALQQIQKSHMQSRGYGDIGYHFLIDTSGQVFQGRSLSWRGAHAGGTDNIGNIGICLLGDFDKSKPDPRALRSLENLIGALSKRHGIPRSAIRGHKHFKATDCPGNGLMAWLKSYTRGRRG